MPDIVERRRNRAPWLALLFTLLAIGLNVLTFVTLRGTEVILWTSFLAGLIALVYGVVGVGRAFGRSHLFGGKISSSVLSLLALLVCALMGFFWYHARALPASTGAPQVGQKVPDFMLPDTQGHDVSLSQLLSQPNSGGAGNGVAAEPKAVLLIFYRGYW